MDMKGNYSYINSKNHSYIEDNLLLMVIFPYHSYISRHGFYDHLPGHDRDPGSPDFLAMAFCMLVLQKNNSQAAKKPPNMAVVYNQRKKTRFLITNKNPSL